MSCLMVNDIDAGLGRFAHTQTTVNNQMVIGTLMNLCEQPHAREHRAGVARGGRG